MTDSVQPKTSLGQKLVLIFFGLILSLVLLELGLRLGGAVFLSIQEYRNKIALGRNGEYRVLCLGESTTANQYPVFLQEELNKARSGVKFSVIDKGVIGTNTSIILEELEANLDRYQPQIVVAMIGINDNGQHIPPHLRELGERRTGWQGFKVYRLFEFLAMHVSVKIHAIVSARKGASQTSLPAWPAAIPVNATYGQAEGNREAPRSGQQRWDAARIWRKVEELQERGKAAEARPYLLELIRRNPRDSNAYAHLGFTYTWGGKNVLAAIIYFTKALNRDPNNIWAVKELGLCYTWIYHADTAETYFKKALAMDPQDEWAYIELASLDFFKERYRAAEELLKAGIARCKRKDRLYGALAMLDILTRSGSKPKEQSLSDIYAEQTVRNYNALYRILKARGIRLVAVQYPVRSVALLKSLFEDKGYIAFVDNEKIFKTAIQEEGYYKLFKDFFGGDFGHCTEKGNRLLAGNIAKAILKQVE